MPDGTSFRCASAGDITGSFETGWYWLKPSPAAVLPQGTRARVAVAPVGEIPLRRRDRQQARDAAAADVVDAREHHVVALDLHHDRRGQALAVELAERHGEVGGMAVPADGEIRTERDLRRPLRAAYRNLPLAPLGRRVPCRRYG